MSTSPSSIQDPSNVQKQGVQLGENTESTKTSKTLPSNTESTIESVGGSQNESSEGSSSRASKIFQGIYSFGGKLIGGVLGKFQSFIRFISRGYFFKQSSGSEELNDFVDELRVVIRTKQTDMGSAWKRLKAQHPNAKAQVVKMAMDQKFEDANAQLRTEKTQTEERYEKEDTDLLTEVVNAYDAKGTENENIESNDEN